RDHDWLRHHIKKTEQVDLKSGSTRDAALMVMGPDSRELLSGLCHADLSATAMPWMSVAELEMAGVQLTAMRVSFGGELGWELHCASADVSKLYAAIAQQGEAFGMINFGSYALNSMRVEKGYHGWGSDFGTEYTLFDAGLDKFIDFDKADFIGREAVLQQRQNSVEWRFIRLAIECDKAEPLSSDPVLLQNECVGYITSGATGFRTGQCIALAYVEAKIPSDESQFEVQILGENYAARAVDGAFYDPENARLRA
ncbi:MAG: aminomethyltransferase family protein, partial [Pseudomonadota bacterium]